jgi:DNA primase
MILDETVERVREAADIVQIIGEHVSLKRTGSDFRGPCPFHQGTHRNFSVSPRKGIYYCFVCHEGGDVFNFLQKRLGLDWPAAVRYVADRAGIEVRETASRRDAPDSREPLWEVNGTAADYFQRVLWDEIAGREARDYLAARRVSREIAERFGIGFAPREPAAMREALNALGFDDERLLATGLLYQRKEDSELRPRFRNRLIFPIFDAANHPVGFGGRLLGPGEPKYVNSAESSIFHKSRLLYGLNWAKHGIRRDDRVLIVEGYFDVVRLASAGFDSVVAPLGTALTGEQAALLRRYTRNAFLLYDSDRAGLKATFRAGDELLRQRFAVQVVTLPEGEDPDSFVDKYGRPKLEGQLAVALDVFERRIQILERAGWFADLRRKRRAVDRLLPTLRATADPVTRDMYLVRASEAAGVAKDVLQREAGDGQRSAGDGEPAQASPPVPPRARERRQLEHRGQRELGQAAERELIRVLLHHPAQLEFLAERLSTEAFQVPPYREIFVTLLRLGGQTPPDVVAAALSEDTVPVLQGLLEEPDAVVDVRRTMEDCLVQLRVRDIQTRLAEIDRTLPLAGDTEKDELNKEKLELMRRIRAMGAVRFRNYGKSRS